MPATGYIVAFANRGKSSTLSRIPGMYVELFAPDKNHYATGKTVTRLEFADGGSFFFYDLFGFLFFFLNGLFSCFHFHRFDGNGIIIGVNG